MRRPPRSNERIFSRVNQTAFARWHLVIGIVLLGCVLAAALIFFARKPPGSEHADASTPPPGSEKRANASDRKAQSREVYATWYDVPFDSLAKRRAGLNELTAAHDKLPLGTLLRVTHLQNGKSVVVRVTDRGIHQRKVKLDICREAADELEMISKGVARVRMEVIPEESGASPPDVRAPAPES